MKKIIYGDKGNFYKANLHCHTTYSDGNLTPERVKEEYMNHGYSVVAFTDHEYIVDQQALTDENFVAINAYEVSFDTRRPGKGDDYKFVINYHLNFYKKTPDDLRHVFWNPANCWCGDKEIQKNAQYVGEIVEKKYDINLINDMIKTAHENNFLVSYNHSRWSLQNYEDYIGLEGIDFLEIYNTGCILSGTDDYLPHIYDDFLRKGKMMYCMCTDDNHNCDTTQIEGESFGGWVVINAPELKYETIIGSLEKGDFYASTGAEIDEISFEDGYVGVKCKNAKYITFTTGTRNAMRAEYDRKTGTPLTEAFFRLYPDDDYVRIEITDMEGNKANSQAYIAEDLFKEN